MKSAENSLEMENNSLNNPNNHDNHDNPDDNLIKNLHKLCHKLETIMYPTGYTIVKHLDISEKYLYIIQRGNNHDNLNKPI